MSGASASRRPSRWLAPAAIVVVAGVVLAIARGGGSGDSGTTTTRSGTGGSGSTETSRTTTKKTVRRTYVVRSGDTLSAISIETGVPVSRIQALNEDVDVQALQPGQRLKLRP